MKKKILSEHVLATPACFRQRVNLPAAQVDGLSPDELAAALGYEVEPFSGIPRAEGVLAWKPMGGPDATRRVFDVVQIRRTDLAKVVAEGRKAKRTVRAVTAPPETAIGETIDVLPWIVLARSGAFAGLFRHPGAWWGAACVVAAVVLAGDYVQIRRETATLREQVFVQRRLQGEKDALNRKLDDLRRELKTCQETWERAANAQRDVAALRAAWRDLLAAVSDACRDEVVVKEIRATGPFAMELAGVALSAEAAGRMVVRLTNALQRARTGWRVQPGRVDAAAAGGTVAFTCAFAFDLDTVRTAQTTAEEVAHD